MTLHKGYFTVPNDVSDERVRDNMKSYIRLYVEGFEKEGWKLESKVRFGKLVPTVDDIKNHENRYYIQALWDMAPKEGIIEVAEHLIPKLLATGKFQEV